MIKWGTVEKQLTIFTDGGARGNPGPAAIAFVIKDEQGKLLVEKGIFIGKATNNIAEYSAVIAALKWIKENFPAKNEKGRYNFFLDSKLVVSQLNGLFKVKNSKLRELIIEVRKLEREVGGNIFYRFVRREKNYRADRIVNKTLNEQGTNFFT